MQPLRHSPTFRPERAPLRPLAASAVRIAPGLPSNPLAALAIGAGLAGWSARQLACLASAPDRLILSAGDRTLIADAIEDLIGVLDADDGEPDREDGHDAEGGTDDNGLGDHDGFAEQYVGTRHTWGGFA